MGVSSNGILAFGIILPGEDNENPLPDLLAELDGGDYYDAFKKFVAWEAGVPEYTQENSKKYFELRQAAQEACPVELVSHCSYEYTMYLLAVKGTVMSARRGSPQVVDFSKLTEEAHVKAERWCDAHNIKWESPSWILCSIYG